MKAQGKAAQAATDKMQRLLVAALLRHQKANEAAAAATLRTEDARARVCQLAHSIVQGQFVALSTNHRMCHAIQVFLIYGVY